MELLLSAQGGRTQIGMYVNVDVNVNVGETRRNRQGDFFCASAVVSVDRRQR